MSIVLHRPSREVDYMHLGLALLATPFVAVLIGASRLADSGLAIFTTVATAVIIGAFALLWKAIVRVLRDEVRLIVRDELDARLGHPGADRPHAPEP